MRTKNKDIETTKPSNRAGVVMLAPSVNKTGFEVKILGMGSSSKLQNAMKEVKFGSVTLTVMEIPTAMVKKNIATGQQALARAKVKILRPGVTISAPKGVPLFYADPKQPGLLVRKMDGKIQSGRFVDGKFKAA